MDITATAQIGGPPSTSSVAASSVVQSGNTLTATFNIGGAVLDGFTFTGIRVNASAAPATSIITISSSGVAGGGVTGSIGAGNYAQVAVSQVTPTLAGGVTQSLCTSTLSATPALVTTLTLQENFLGSFRTLSQETQGGAGSAFVQATQGTRVAVTFNNLDAGVNYYVPAALAATVAADFGAGATNTLTASAFAAASGGTALTAVTAGSGAGKIAGQVLLTVTNGSATIYYGITASDALAVSVITIPLIETVPSAPAVTAVSALPVTASAYLVGVATGYPQYAAVTTPTAINQPALPATNSILTACSTTLLFPYVVNTGGFDTGVAISNASTVPGLPAAQALTPTAGSCAVTFYGAGAGTAPANAYSTGTIPTATDAVFLASVVQPGIQGYAVATCNFQGAHGYAFITDGFGGGGRGLSADYLAVVLAANGIVAGTVQF
ncbi:MAG TPA: hypothetical protein VG273_04880 [Bryobacteraceae bacterium]|nr:hypothetical protein [Bryobacteraceae bacterium]